MKVLLLLGVAIISLSGCAKPLSDEQVKIVAQTCQSNGMVIEVVNVVSASSAKCVAVGTKDK